MKAVLLLVAMVFAAGLASAEEFYSQPLGDEMQFLNASTVFNTEVADDIPAGFAGMDITGVTIFVRQWGTDSSFVNPSAIIINFFDGACPPSIETALSFSVPWSEAEIEFLEAWYTPFQQQNYLYAVTVALPEAVTITEAMSLGTTIETDWGTEAPYTGVNCTDNGVVFGCGEGYIAGHFGVPRWTPISDEWMWTGDLAYTLHTGPVAVESSSWGEVKSLYR